ncbi:DUF2254 domain-containing protein [Defluviimonas sp. WL0050]|uniref:DUF2254 domain-containing protein n=1 Tax=Albidovulum litorale TaxID=2984134 RepID=A0ABT2ZNH5_9RHOB|nr:DUF2254 domain-containing protein [Defluviimonas sp. WL0050]MCV2872648.1 DUF2254 domain-containing protein [Defluviimonas sp. WL0050]
MTWRTPFTALLTVPATIAIAIGLSGAGIVAIEHRFNAPDWLIALSPDVARAILSSVATAAMTALSLTYSLTLVVFTLAASSIGPRLLKRFTTERANQITAGLLGGTFLYALVVLGTTGNEPARIATFIAGLLAAASVVQLIWFVRTVAQSVSIDDELAKIAVRLRDGLARLKQNSGDDDDLPDDNAFLPAVTVKDTGYLARLDRSALLASAITENLVLRVEQGEGDYLLPDTVVLSVNRPLRESVHTALCKTVRQEPARSDTGTVHFSINLMVEIALRALSPGVNDTLTALAVSDMLSGALAEIAGSEPRPEVLRDPEGRARVILPGASFPSLLDTAYNPLRRASADNVLMAEGLARGLRRLHAVASANARRAVEEHADLLLRQMERAGHMPADIAAVRTFLPDAVLE